MTIALGLMMVGLSLFFSFEAARWLRWAIAGQGKDNAIMAALWFCVAVFAAIYSQHVPVV